MQLALKLIQMQRAFGTILGWADLLRAGLVALAVAAGVVAALDAGVVARVALAFVLAFGVLPLAALALGLLQPLRILRYAWRSRGFTDVAAFGDLLCAVAADAREHSRRRRGSHGRADHLDRGQVAMLCYRVARHFHLNGRRRLARAVKVGGEAATRLRIDPASPTKPEGGPA